MLQHLIIYKMLQLYCHINTLTQLYISKCALSASAVSFIPVTTLSVNPAMSFHVHNILVSFNTTCHVRKVSPYIPLSVNSSTTHVDYVSHVQHSRCLSFRSKVSVAYNFKYVSLSPLYTILVVILFNMFSFTQSAKATLVCNIFSIIALFLLVCVRFYTKNCERLIYCIVTEMLKLLG